MTRRIATLALSVAAGIALCFPLLGARDESAAGRPAPEISGDVWLNSEPLTLAALRGKVVLVEFWTFACWNCQNVEPYVKDWHERYKDQGLVVIGVHSPEFEREKDVENVRRYVREHGIRHAIAIDNGFRTWRRFGNHYWPALYLIGADGVIRYTRIGEGGYGDTESTIEQLLAEARAKP